MAKKETLLERALRVAYEAHKGQRSFSGRPYIFHCIRVMEQMDTEEEKAAALLHDVIEDTDITEDGLEEIFHDHLSVVATVRDLTKPEEDTYEEYIEYIGLLGSHEAVKIKIADLKDNMRVERNPNMTQGVFKRLRKYRKALNYLLEIQNG